MELIFLILFHSSFFSGRDLMHHKLIPEGQMLNKGYYLAALKRLL